MISWDSGLKCEEARAYYYDCVDAQCADETPQSIRMHIGRCNHCREEIRRLGQALSTASTSGSKETSHISMVNALLEMHFKYAETPVTCAVAKRFLPSMAGAGTRITIPTPITVHIEQCSKCRNDWIELQSLNLSDVQLQCLTECIEERGVHRPISRHEHLSNEQVQAFARVDYADLDAACLEHVCECVSCRKRALTVRQTVASHLKVESHDCQAVSWEDLFDLAVPVGFNPLADEYAQFRKATVDHVGRCETCLRRLGVLDQILINFLPPHECGVVTHFQMVLDEAQVCAEAAYEDYPIRVDVQNSACPHIPEVSDEVDPVFDRGRAHSNRGWVKVAVAAVVLVGMSISFMLPRAGAGFLDHVYEATTSAPVVHIRTLSGENFTSTEEIWILPPRVVKIEGRTVTTFNASSGAKITMNAAGVVNPITLSGDARKSLQANIRGLFDLWSLEMSELATLNPEASDLYDVYDAQLSDGRVTQEWQASVDRDTQRVARVDRVDKDAKTGYRHTRRFEVDYPSLSEAGQRLQQRGIDLNSL